MEIPPKTSIRAPPASLAISAPVAKKIIFSKTLRQFMVNAGKPVMRIRYNMLS
jgi:hypothetical protein